MHPRRVVRPCEFPGGHHFTVGGKLQPSLIYQCDVEIRKDLCASVVLSGNTSIFQAIGERVTLAPNCTIDLPSSDGLAGMKVDNDRLGQLRVSALAVCTFNEGMSLGSQGQLSSFCGIAIAITALKGLAGFTLGSNIQIFAATRLCMLVSPSLPCAVLSGCWSALSCDRVVNVPL